MRRFADFLKNARGSIAVEFAFVAPVMLGLFFGLAELASAEGARGDVVNLASVGADLVAQEKSATTSDMTNVFNALAAMMYPYDTSNVQITISSIIDNNTTTTGKVAWSCTKNGSALSVGGTYTFPTAAQGVITKGGGGSVIMAVVSYSYSLPVTVSIPGILNLSGPYTMSNTFYSKPRKVSQIPLTSCP